MQSSLRCLVTDSSFPRKAVLRVTVNIDLPVRLGQPHFFLKIDHALRWRHRIGVTVQNEDVPEVPAEERATVKELSPGIHRVTIRYGFMESPNMPRELAALKPSGIDFDPMQASFFLGRETLVAATVPKLPVWRLWLFLVMARNAVPATEFFRIPSDRVVELGVRVAI